MHAEAVEESLTRRREQLPSGESDAEIEAMRQRQLQEWDAAFRNRQAQQMKEQPGEDM